MLSLMLVPLGICRAFDFSGEFLDKIPTKGPSKWVKSVDRVVSKICCPAGLYLFISREA